MYARLIEDEGHRNATTLAERTDRRRGWLLGSYEAVVFDVNDEVAGYAPYRVDPEHAHLRQLCMVPSFRRRRVARVALRWLWRHARAGGQRWRVDAFQYSTTSLPLLLKWLEPVVAVVAAAVGVHDGANVGGGRHRRRALHGRAGWHAPWPSEPRGSRAWREEGSG